MTAFNYKIFNPEVFAKYTETVPRVKQNALLKAGVLRNRPEIKAMFTEQVGGNYATIPMHGLISGTALNYDGATNITAGTADTYSQSVVVVGRAAAWKERDFSYDITGGVDFMSNVAGQVVDYWDDVDQITMLKILDGIFKMTGTENLKFVNGHTLDIANEATDNVVGATTLNKAIQKACGANKNIFTAVLMHSEVATNLENLNCLEYLKYTDAMGVQRDLGMATWNGRIVLIDDDMPVTEGYYDATSSTTGALKVVASGASTGEINLASVTPYFGSKTLAANDYVVKGDRYTSYVLGEGAFGYVDCGAKVPYEMDRDPATNGGEDVLYTRQRKVFAPYGVSFTKSSMTSNSPTDTELATAANWKLVEDSAGSGKINHKAIPIARILSRG